MKELSLYILDITMNSVKAGAKNISISLGEYDGIFSFSVEDDGCGMTKEQLERLSDPFFTTRTTRKVGLGVPVSPDACGADRRICRNKIQKRKGVCRSRNGAYRCVP